MLGYIKCYSSSSPRPAKSSCNSIRYNCQKICSWSKRPKAILKIRKRPHFSRWSNSLVTCFSKTLLTTGKKTNRAGVFSCRPYPNILKYRDDWRKPLTIWKTRLFWTQFFRTTTGIQSGPNACDKSRLVMTFLTILGVTEMLYSFRLVLEAKTGREIPDSSRSEFLEKF